MLQVQAKSTETAQPISSLVESGLNHCINKIAQAFFFRVEEQRFRENKNFFYFTPTLLPLFGMLYAGAPESVKEDLEAFLGEKESNGRIHQAFGEWLEEKNDKCPSIFVDPIGWLMSKVYSVAAWLFPSFFPSTASATSASWKTMTDKGVLIAHREGTTIAPQASGALSHYGIESVTFTSNKEATAKSNKWISAKTQGAIQDLVPEMEGDPVALLLLAAASFKSSWEHPFPQENTQNRTFHNSDGTDSSIPMMQLETDNLRVADKGQVSMLELPMQGNLAMYVVKAETDFLPDFLSSEAFMGILDDVGQAKDLFQPISSLTVTLPKIDLKDRVNILDELNDDPLIQKIATANWQGSLMGTSDRQPLSVSHMVSQTNLSLDETGVAIKAASAAGMVVECVSPTFEVNRPFGLVLFDKTSKTILGMGQMNKFEAS